ncbi:GGDEF domain-containing protein [Cognatilysobacter bugurensis]|uniref:diguanylate cyclase n=1 Tax=Cognatilysobacter bugurensis TaxID=543356 RepID=A0A918SYY6_9GAMM|nr:diguanylate cyclase [Lysobacter bugurensis]GHA79063.1 diguanylate cyclase response regulator [Lysobacter bugurensis]
MKILVAEDDATSRLVLGATLRSLGHDVTAVEDGAAALEAWRRDEYGLVISDWLMPLLDGPGLCRHIRAEHRPHYTYVVLLTSLEGKGNYLSGIEAGADDFVTKPLDRDVLAARLSVAERIIGLHEALRVEATRDRLTGLLNRGAILDALQRELLRAAREGGPTATMLLDVDHFKHVNDTYGHLVGDIVLREIAQRLQLTLRPYDRVGRFGGEEFIVLITDGDADQSALIAERIRTAVAAEPVDVPGGESVSVTVSIGIAIGQSAADAADGLLAAADIALYRAKANGRDRVEVEPMPAS